MCLESRVLVGGGKVVSLCIVLASSRLWSASKHVSNVPGREFIVCASSLTLSFEVLNGLGTVVGRSLRKPFCITSQLGCT